MKNLKNLTLEELDDLYNEACEATNECYYNWQDNNEVLTVANDNRWTKACQTVEACEAEYERRGLI